MHTFEAPSRPSRCFAVLLLCVTMGLTACISGDRATPTPTVFSQPTADQTMDGVVRGLVTIGLPRVTMTTTTASQRAPAPAAPPPAPTPLPVSTLPLAPTLAPFPTIAPFTSRPTITPAGEQSG
jgi:hypothetical protein